MTRRCHHSHNSLRAFELISQGVVGADKRVFCVSELPKALSQEEARPKEELKWLLREAVHAVLADIQQTLQECCRCFPMPMESVDDTEAVTTKDNHITQRILLSTPSTATAGQMKCVITLKGDCISEAIQDAANHLQEAIALATLRDKDYKFSSAKEVLTTLEELMKKVKAGQLSLTLPKRKSLQELVSSKNMQIFQPPIPSDVALSFYVHGCKLVLAVYHLHTNGQHRLDISHRKQMEVVVQWMNEAIICFTLALQQCQQLFDKAGSVSVGGDFIPPAQFRGCWPSDRFSPYASSLMERRPAQRSDES